MKINEALSIIDSAYQGGMFFPHTPGLGEACRVVADGYRAAVKPKEQEEWVSVIQMMPKLGESVEVAKFMLSNVHKAVYEPDENQFYPWRLIDYMPTGIWRRQAEAVTHWRRGPEPGKGENE
jgi:hypothetical protein